ncbi:hypothetical protein OEZ86_014381 [Tetradesmus obliquus]|nr:hypothetical protein OEZ86_014381 [Tetradesmus obliquus]
MTGLEHEADEGGAHDASLSANNFTCAICFELLLDPVVGSCGHDFCMHCITAWKDERQRANKSIQCPVCRSELISPYQPFGVCIRIRETIEKLFPEQLAVRRRDVEQARLAAAAHAAALNASAQFGGAGYATADAELQASFSTGAK